MPLHVIYGTGQHIYSVCKTENIHLIHLIRVPKTSTYLMTDHAPPGCFKESEITGKSPGLNWIYRSKTYSWFSDRFTKVGCIRSTIHREYCCKGFWYWMWERVQIPAVSGLAGRQACRWWTKVDQWITNKGLNIFRSSGPRHCPYITRVHLKNKADTWGWVSTLSQNSQHLDEIQEQKILIVEAEFGSSLISSFIRNWTWSCSFSTAKTCCFLSNYGHIDQISNVLCKRKKGSSQPS